MGVMLTRKKYQLPLVQRIPHVHFDIQKLRQEVVRYNNLWTSIFNANQELCSAHPELAEKNYEHFDQINFTTYKNFVTKEADIKGLKEDCRHLSETIRQTHGRIGSYKKKITRSQDINPALNEHNWNQPLDFYRGSYIEQEIGRQFRALPIRVRMVRLKAGKSLTPHIDYDPTYAVRVVVPIITDLKVTNSFWKKGDRYDVHLPADGSAYFLNVGFAHSVENKSSVDRISLMFSLDSQLDLQKINLEDSPLMAGAF